MGLTFDTGALIGLERERHAMRKVYVTAIANELPITVPAVVIAEWWRAGAREKERARILRSVIVEPITDLVARLAGVALTLVPEVHTVDALVMASASQRGNEVVYTSDPSDFEALRNGVPAFASVRIERA
jgi:predicted nucleic acid-binding protein